ncbi:YdcF family protein [Pseudomonas sp. F1_0610]|uniref:YdcF family protein n=1 Tax=Pseudomonas sp. F1_0610 TaxID=3114284 RepID=UPI0039C340C1
MVLSITQPMLKRILKTLIYLVLLLCLFTAGLVAYVWHYTKPRTIEHAQATIVLGAAAWGDYPSPVFKERINHAIHIYQNKLTHKLVFTGGTVKQGYATEGEVGARWAIRKGVPENDIYIEGTSRDTWHNLKNAHAILQQHNINSVIIVSDSFHLARAKIMARDLNFKVQVSPTPTSRYNNSTWTDKLGLYMREGYLILLHKYRYLTESDY